MARAKTINPQDLRRSNRANALAAVYLNGPMTRLGIASAAGVSAATASNLVTELLDYGAIIESGALKSAGGRPRVLLQINPDFGYVVGVAVGETTILVELFDLQMQVRASHTVIPPASGLEPEETVAQVLAGLALVIAESGVAEDKILGVGVGIPGLVKDGDEVHTQTLGWEGVPIGTMLRRGTSLPLFVDNGVRTFGQAEKWFGAGRDAANSIMVLLGSGVGIALFADGELYRGATGSAGEWGHTTVVLDGTRCRCGAFGCLEAYIGGDAVVRRYDEVRGAEPDTDNDFEDRMADIAAAGPADTAAKQVLEEYARFLGAGLADLINLFNPERIVIGGWVAQVLGEPMLAAARAAASEHALAMPFRDVSIVAAKLGADAVAL
ncbi:MAG: hypothetical protein JWM93_3535, partial [Frankiales bacterium]|nr:hypothetical protein [Frankiales bacterium]